MKAIYKFLSTALIFAVSVNANAGIISLPINGVVNDNVTGDSAWILEDTFGDGLDFITFDVTETSEFSASIDALISFGMSLYEGTVTNDFAIPFSNSGDFTDLFGDLLYITGSDPFVPGIGSQIDSIELSAGNYTLALGGNEGFFDDFTTFNYALSTQLTSVPEPSHLFLLFFGLAGLLAARKQQK